MARPLKCGMIGVSPSVTCISRRVFANIVERARYTVADAFIYGRARKISHGAVPNESSIPKHQTSEE